MISEFAQNGSLLDVLKNKKGKKLDDDALLRFACDAATGVAHLHAEGVVHCDIAARNFLVSKDWTVMVTDFGLSRVVEVTEGQEAAAQRTQSIIGPVRWMAPESIRDSEYSSASDVYTIGMFLFELISGGRPPFEEMSAQVVWSKKSSSPGFQPQIPAGAPSLPLLWKLMLECWRADPQQRLSMRNVLRKMRSEVAEDGVYDGGPLTEDFSASSSAPTSKPSANVTSEYNTAGFAGDAFVDEEKEALRREIQMLREELAKVNGGGN